MPSKDDPSLKIRLPLELLEWIKEQAQANRRSMTSHIAHLLELARRAESGVPATGKASSA